MPAISLRVSLLSVTPNAEALVYANAKQCTSADDAFNVYTQAIVDKKNNGVPFIRQQDIIRRVMASGHLGIVEPVVFSFGVAGVSRALSHQLVRQRIASFCQQSQRYVKADGFNFIIPKTVEECGMGADYILHMQKVSRLYLRMIEAGVPAEDARFVLSNACETKICVTMNAHSLLNFFERRCCIRSQWEIRALANEMLRLCKDAAPVLFETAGARCERMGFCEEEKCCGRAPRLKDVIDKYKEESNG